ncbi:MAG: acyl-CoA dehydrogenase family protein [Steroidobacteraceae bacterium]
MPTPDDDIGLLRDSARRWVAAHVRCAQTEANHRQRWREMVELGWSGIAIDEHRGGSGLGVAGVVAVLTELGRERMDSPLVSSALLAPLLIQALGDEEQRRRWLAAIAAGDTLLAVAIDDSAHHAPYHIATTATRTSQGWELTGEKRFVVGGSAADHFLVAARIAGVASEEAIFIVPAERVQRQTLAMVDCSDCASLTLAGIDVDATARLGMHDSGAAIDAALDAGRVALAAEMLGLAQSALDTTVEYLRTREQFGQPIGAFQALQHRAAQAYAQLQLANACLDAAVQAVAEGRDDLAELASLTKVTAGDALHLISNEMVQMHGGIGMTDEHIAGRVLKRARVLEAMLGNSHFHARRYATLRGF